MRIELRKPELLRQSPLYCTSSEDTCCTLADSDTPAKSQFQPHSRWWIIRFEIGVIFTAALLMSAILLLIYQNPDQAPRSLSLEKHSREIAQINEESREYQLAGSEQKFNDSKKLMQEKLKEVAREHMGLEISSVDLVDYPFRNSQAMVEKFGLDPSSVCDIAHKIPLHMQKISQTGSFGLFAKKYSPHEIEIYIMDERSWQSNVHYGLDATNGKGQRASTYFHLSSCTDEITDKGPYLLRCSDENDGYSFTALNQADIVSSFASHHFCRIDLDPWRQSLFEYGKMLRDQIWQFQTESMPELVDSESLEESFAEMNRQDDLAHIVWVMIHGEFGEQDTQDMIKRYEEKYGSLPAALLDLIGEGGETEVRSQTAPPGDPDIPTIIIPAGSGMSDVQPDFEPRTLKVTLGINSTVRWVNVNETPLSIASDSKYDGLEFFSPHLMPGDTWEFTFPREGVFDYHSNPYPWMTGQVVVMGNKNTLLPQEKTYSYENATHPPLEPIGSYSDYFVGNVHEASEIAGYAVSEPILPEGTKLQLIGIHGDGVVQLYASPHQISEETLDKEFTYDLQGILILYERVPERLSNLDANTLVERWAEGEGVQASLKSNGRAEAVKEISTGRGPGGEFDIPARVITSISDDVQVSIGGFYDGSTLRSILAN